jgi:hypothetical protein
MGLVRVSVWLGPSRLGEVGMGLAQDIRPVA